MKVLKFVSVSLVIFLILIFLMKKCGSEVFRHDAREELCEIYTQMKFLAIDGSVDSVFEDKRNHSANTVRVKTGNSIQVVYLEADRSGLFDYLQKNDSILKRHNSYEVVVKRNNDKSRFILDFGCPR